MTGDKIIVTVDADLEALIPGFLSNREADLQTLKTAHEQQCFEIIKGIGHNLKGLGGGYGFHGLSDIGEVIEQAAKDRDLEMIATHIKALSRYLESVEITYE